MTANATNSSINWFKYAAPIRFYFLINSITPWCWAGAFIFSVVGLWIGFMIAPTDAQQGDAYRIIFIHVPTAWLSMVLYVAMAFWGSIGLIFKAKLAYRLSNAIAPTGALMTLIALITGALWGKPTWGTWWVWDARLTTELILLFLYLGYLSLYSSIEDKNRADKASALLALIGVINVPVIYFSVKWWNTLHQGATITMTKAPSMATPMLLALLLTTIGCWLYCFAIIFSRTQSYILERDAHSHWAQDEIQTLGKKI
ncbi:MAG: heme ABC transporter permease CcmC [Betaproteobacteria bacterium]